jgi:putative ABC transport system substrate-binding protein
MRRRDFVMIFGGALVASPIEAVAQESNRKRRVGVLMGIGDDDPEAKPRLDALENGLRALGWTDDRILLDVRWTAGDLNKTRLFAKEIIDLKPDVVVVHGTPGVKALRELTSTVPMVFVLVADPIGSGFVASLAHPGGNLTGFMNVDAPMASKWLELIKEIAPATKRVALVFNPRTSPYESFLRSFNESAPRLQLEAIETPVFDAAGIEQAITTLGREPDTALFVVPDIFVQVHRELIVKLAVQNRLAAIYPYRFFVTSGGLMSYGIDTVIVFRQAAEYADKMLRGTPPADLPVQAPTTFKLIVNTEAAKAIGLSFSESFLARADEVIE